MNSELEAHICWFKEYADGKIRSARRDAGPLRLKLEHSLHVLDNARKMTLLGNLAPEPARICLLAALYHDIARFEQYLVYGTFRDRDSRNHGLWGVKILKNTGRLENDPCRGDVFCAIALHNRFALPKRLEARRKMACNLVRAADKLDILRVMDDHLSGPGPYNPTVILSLPDDDKLASPAVSATVLAGKVASYNDLESVNDFRLLLGSWFFDLHVAGAKKLFLEAGHAQRLVESIPANDQYRDARDFLLKTFNGPGQ